MAEPESNQGLVAACGLYCGACGAFLKGKCRGCRENAKAAWCKVRSCCLGKNIRSCADCGEFNDPKACKKFNNIISKIFGLVFGSDRPACIALIREKGYGGYSSYMAGKKQHSLKRPK